MERYHKRNRKWLYILDIPIEICGILSYMVSLLRDFDFEFEIGVEVIRSVASMWVLGMSTKAAGLKVGIPRDE